MTLARISEGQREEMAVIYRSLVELFEKARMAIESANIALCQTIQSQSQFQRAPDCQKESVEDFMRRMECLGNAGYEHLDLDLLSPSKVAWVESHKYRG